MKVDAGQQIRPSRVAFEVPVAGEAAPIRKAGSQAPAEGRRRT